MRSTLKKSQSSPSPLPSSPPVAPSQTQNPRFAPPTPPLLPNWRKLSVRPTPIFPSFPNRKKATRTNDSAQNATDKLLADLAESTSNTSAHHPAAQRGKPTPSPIRSRARPHNNNPPTCPVPAAAPRHLRLRSLHQRRSPNSAAESGYDPRIRDEPGSCFLLFRRALRPGRFLRGSRSPRHIGCFIFSPMTTSPCTVHRTHPEHPRQPEALIDQIMQSPHDSDRLYARDLIRRLQAANPASTVLDSGSGSLRWRRMNGSGSCGPPSSLAAASIIPAPTPT